MAATPDPGPTLTDAPAEADFELFADDEAQVREMLRGYGLRSTAQRLAILHLLATAGHYADSAGTDGAGGSDSDVRVHLTATQIHDRLREMGQHIDITTVYRSLNTLAELGVLHTIAHAPNLTTYGLATANHHHAVCTRCGAVAEIPADRLAATLDDVHDTTGFRTAGAAITVRGLCADCGRA